MIAVSDIKPADWRHLDRTAAEIAGDVLEPCESPDGPFVWRSPNGDTVSTDDGGPARYSANPDAALRLLTRLVQESGAEATVSIRDFQFACSIKADTTRSGVLRRHVTVVADSLAKVVTIAVIQSGHK